MKVHGIATLSAWAAMMLFNSCVTGAGQEASTSPIVVDINEVDHEHVYVGPSLTNKSISFVSFVFANKEEAEVEALLDNGIYHARPVHVLKERIIIGKGTIVGGTRCEVRRGFMLQFDSGTTATNVATAMQEERFDDVLERMVKNLRRIRNSALQ